MEAVMDGDLSARSRLWVLMAAIFQGAGLVLVYSATSGGLVEQPAIWLGLYTLVLAGPVLLMLSLGQGGDGHAAIMVVAFSVLLAALAAYVGSQVGDQRYSSLPGFVFVLQLTLVVAAFKGLMYIQCFASGQPLTYSRLFLLSWRNFILLGLALLFALMADGLVLLCGGLFKAVGMDGPLHVFTSPNFYLPFIAIATGCGVLIFRRQLAVIDTITRIQQALMKFLLVLLVVVSITFLLALPFTGLQALWDSGGSGMVMTMQAVMLFFLNAVYQDDPEVRPYPLWLHRFIMMGVALLPIYSLISVYGISLRVSQYGWSVSRCWASLLWVALAGFSFLYLVAIVRRGDRWLHQVSKVNVGMGLVLLMLMLLVNSPLLDFRRITVASQMARLESGELQLDDVDISYFSRALGVPGQAALAQIGEQVRDQRPELAKKLLRFDEGSMKTLAAESLSRLMSIITYVDPAPDALKNDIRAMLDSEGYGRQTVHALWLVQAELNGASPGEYILVIKTPYEPRLKLFYKEGERWLWQNMHSARHPWRGTWDGIEEALREKSYSAEHPHWKQFKLGNDAFEVR